MGARETANENRVNAMSVLFYLFYKFQAKLRTINNNKNFPYFAKKLINGVYI